LKFIDALRLKSKLFFLFILITLGLTFIGVLGTLNLISMKKKIDSLYFGSFITVINLDEILNAYNVDIASNIFLAKEKIITSQEAIDAIDGGIVKIDKNWTTYQNQYKAPKERPFINYTVKEVENSKHYFKQLKLACLNGCDLEQISIDALNVHVSHMRTIMSKLRSYEIESAEYQRKELLQNYHETQIKLGLILGLVSGGVLLILFIVFRSIQKDQSELETLSKKLQVANKKLENASYTDSLTHLYNRRFFNIVLGRELKRAIRAKSNITFMMLDVDYFKQYNDTYGHIEGDKALLHVAKVLKSVLKRPGDFVFRLGGEEFGVLLTEVTFEESEALAAKICQTMEAEAIPHAGNQASSYLTISIGVLTCKAHEELDEEDMIKEADKKLYEAKEGGRNRYVMSERPLK
jgi:diguanylate cyclase (GGDEF)-like protein